MAVLIVFSMAAAFGLLVIEISNVGMIIMLAQAGNAEKSRPAMSDVRKFTYSLLIDRNYTVRPNGPQVNGKEGFLLFAGSLVPVPPLLSKENTIDRSLGFRYNK